MADELKVGDRVEVYVPYDRPERSKHFVGKIVGEARDGHSWQIIKDGTRFARGIHKSFCKPEDSP